MTDSPVEVALVDYGMGNIRSVDNALTMAGASCTLVRTPDEVGAIPLVVVPGVGAFGDGMQALQERGWPVALPDLVAAGKHLFGICLGMQLLADESTEHGTHRGLGLIAGRVEQLRNGDEPIRIPHMGWDDVDQVGSSTLFEGLEDPEDFYFVHGFAFEPEDPDTAIATCTYGRPFAVAVRQDRVLGVQFHPEKSQRAGQRLLRNLLDEVGRC